MSLQAPGNTDPARLDRRVTLQQADPARDSAGGVVLTYSELATVWAGKAPGSGGRLYGAEAKHYEATLIYRIRHRPDVRPGLRLVHGDDLYEVVAVEEIGRRHYLDLFLRGLDQTPGDNRAYLDAGDGTTLLDAGDGNTLLDAGVAA
jgi:SPP1 family predicted phage head-tail adaptor